MRASRIGLEPVLVIEPVLVTCVQAGQMLGGLKPWPVMKLCDAGELRWGYIGEVRMIEVESVREYAKRVTSGSLAQS